MDESSDCQSDALSVFCREVRNLLRSKPNCMIPFSKFVPAYHNHYGRQCCVYSFGYTKLIELLEAIPHVVQILGEGNNRYITLTHREQMKRFASDLIKVVKSQPGKKMRLSQFARAYEQVLGRTFHVEDYGTRNINILLDEIWEGTINIMPIRKELCDPDVVSKPLYVNSPAENISKPYITEQYPDAWFGIPKRERSDKEVKRTKYFIWDVIELLSHMEPDYSVQFSKFIPAYHYYFNRQCKVSIFGFSKLIDLFEFISPDVVEIIDDEMGDEKVIKLAEKYIPKARNGNRNVNNANRNNSDNKTNNQDGKSPTTHKDCYVGKDCFGLTETKDEKERRERRIAAQAAGRDQEDEEEEEEDDNDDDEVASDEIFEDDIVMQERVEMDAKKARDSIGDNENDDDDLVDVDEYEDDDLDDDSGDDILMPHTPIDNGPTEEELRELEDELEAYEELKAIQSKRSLRMAAMLDIFKQPIY